MTGLSVKIEGLDRLIKKTSPDLLRAPLKRFFERAAISVENRAKRNAPVDTGRLRSSLTHELDSADVPRFARVGTNVKYAPFMEFGTGLFSDAEGASHTRHWPPPDALGGWAKRHGFASGYAVAAAIGKRGGLKPRRYLRNALKDSLGDIRGFMDRLGREISEAWDKK